MSAFQNGTPAPRSQIRNLRLSKVNDYLVDNVTLLRLSNLWNVVKRKKRVVCRLEIGMRVWHRRVMQKTLDVASESGVSEYRDTPA